MLRAMLVLRVTDHRSVRRGCAWLEALRTRWLRVRSAPAIHTTKHLLACLCKRAPRGAAPFCGVRFRLAWGRRWRPFFSWLLPPHLSPSAAPYNRVSFANLEYPVSTTTTLQQGRRPVAPSWFIISPHTPSTLQTLGVAMEKTQRAHYFSALRGVAVGRVCRLRALAT